MEKRSSPIISNQQDPHQNLSAAVKRHQNTKFKKPTAQHTQQVFQQADELATKHNHPIILDSGCGTAISTRNIAKLHPNAFVIGIDRSIDRLSRNYEDPLPENAITIRADLVDFWLLAVEAGWKLQHHFILYPNPYPKSAHLKRRWHGHPIFPTLLKLGGVLELRTNWEIYAEEFAMSLRMSGYSRTRHTPFTPKNSEYWTLFEKKYHLAGQTLYRCQVDLNQRQEKGSANANSMLPR